MIARIEFWEESRFLAAMDTAAPPPPVGAVVNVRGQDYEVALVDYSIDRAGEPVQQYRRNVHLRKIAELKAAECGCDHQWIEITEKQDPGPRFICARCSARREGQP